MTTVGSLCTGYGGLDRALEHLGCRTVWVAEVDPDASKSARSTVAGGAELRRHQGGGLVSRSRRRGGGSVRTTPDTSGRPSPTPFASYDPDGCWRTSQLTLDSGSAPFSGTWPQRGSMRNGECFQRPPLAPPTSAAGSGLLLPTPAASQDGNSPEDHVRRKREMGRTNPTTTNPTTTNLDVLARNGFEPLLPTPEASDGTGGRKSSARGGQRPSGAKRSISLATAVDYELLPTPVKGDGDRGSASYGRGNPTLIGSLLPTPTRRDGEEGRCVPSPELAAARRAAGRRVLEDAIALLPTPTATDSAASRNTTARRSDPDSGHHDGTTLTDALVATEDPVEALLDDAGRPHLGRYEAAVRRWEHVLGRPAPHPVHGKAVNARFVEWMMGQPDGWVTGILANRKALRVLGNGVVTQQALAAIVALDEASA